MMPNSLYLDIVHTIAANDSVQDIQDLLEEKYPSVSTLSLGSILRNLIQRRMKKVHHARNSSEQITAFYNVFEKSVELQEPPGIIVRMADKAGLCPTLMARFVLEGYLRLQHQQLSKPQIELSKDGLSQVNRLPPINLAAIKADVSRLLKDTSELQNPHLAYEVHLSTVFDNFYGPIPDAIKATVGKQYEKLLEEQLTQLGVSFVDEAELRRRGYDKTPDFKLELPIGVDGQVVNWIESKATFGDEETHKGYLEEQLLSYKNRYGSGLVMYWLGYVETLHDSSVTPSGILIRDTMPDNIVHMKPS